MASLRHAAAHGMSFMGGLRHEKHTFVHEARQITQTRMNAKRAMWLLATLPVCSPWSYNV